MTNARARLARRGLAAGLGLVVAWALSGLLAAYALTSRAHPRCEERPPEGEVRFRSLRLSTRDGVGLGAWTALRDDAAPSVLLLHGHGASRSAMTDEASALHRAGASVMAVSLRAHGDSEGERDDLGWSARRDVVAAVEALERERGGRPVVVLGYSAGAAAAIYAARELGPRVQRYVLVAPYASLTLATRHRTQRYLPPVVELVAYGALRVGALALLPELDRMSPRDHADALAGTRTLFVAGGADDRAPPDEVRSIAARAGAPVLVVPGVTHESLETLVELDAWREITVAVL